jgi:hypothetical protein
MPLFHISWLARSNKIDASVMTGEILRKALKVTSTSNFTNLKISAKMLKIPNIVMCLKRCCYLEVSQDKVARRGLFSTAALRS